MPAPFTHETLMTVYRIFLSDSSAARSIPAWFVWTDMLLGLSFPFLPNHSKGRTKVSTLQVMDMCTCTQCDVMVWFFSKDSWVFSLADVEKQLLFCVASGVSGKFRVFCVQLPTLAKSQRRNSNSNHGLPHPRTPPPRPGSAHSRWRLREMLMIRSSVKLFRLGILAHLRCVDGGASPTWIQQTVSWA